MMKTRLLVLTSAVAVTAMIIGCSDPAVESENIQITDNASVAESDDLEKSTSDISEESAADTISQENSGVTVVTDISQLSAQPAYGANTDYAYWTTIPYMVEDAQIQFTATVSADEALEAFEVQCQFFEDQLATVEYVEGTLTTTQDNTGFMTDIAPDVVQYAIKSDRSHVVL